MNVVLTNAAKDDLKAIYHYSFENYGEYHTDKYYFGLADKIESIATGFVASTNLDHVREGLKRTNFRSHAIYYRVTDDSIVVVRVLGQAQDAQRHIN